MTFFGVPNRPTAMIGAVTTILSSRLFKSNGYLFAVLEGQSLWDIFPGTEAADHREVCPDFCLHRFQDFQTEPQTVLKGSPIFICSVVDQRRKKLADQIPVSTLQLEHVNATLSGPTRCL
jgi:hypothetical protein